MKCKIKNKELMLIFACLYISAQAQPVIPDSLKETQPVKTVAYGTQPEWEVTSSLSTVTGDVLGKSYTSNVANTLYGRLPGLTVQQGSGEPGNDSPSLNIRGVSTFGDGKKIFIVIDGIPSSERFFQQLTPQEIETITVLKDASATVIYGQRAANGVLLITTKRGIEAPLKVSFSAKYGIQQLTRLPDFLGSYDYARLYNEGLLNDDPTATLRYSDDDLNAYQNNANPQLYPNVNWYKELLRDVTPYSDYNMTVKGGNRTAKYFVLFNVTDNRGQYQRTEKIAESAQNQSYTRYNFRTNVDVQLATRLLMNVTIGGTVEDKTNPGIDNNTDELFKRMASIPSNAFPVYTSPGKPGGSGLYTNPLADISQRGYVSYNGRAAQAAVKLNGDLGMITPGLSIAGVIGFNTYFKSFSKKTKNYTRYLILPDGTEQRYGESTTLTPEEKQAYQWRNYAVQGFLNYDRTFGRHNVSAILIANYDDSTEGNNYNDETANDIFPYKNAELGGRFTYAFDKRYIVEFAFSYSGNDRFADHKRYGFFPAGSLGWVVSNEEFLKGNEVLSFLKIRGSYGLTGNQNIGGQRYTWNQNYVAANYHFGENNTEAWGLVPGTLATPDATWEKQKQFDGGLDFKLFNRWNFEFDYFEQNRYDILAKPNSTIPDYIGKRLPLTNVGKVENKGFEVTVGYTGNPMKELKYFVNAGVWFARNKITFNAEEPQLYEYLYKTGHRIDQPFLLEYSGFFNSDEEAANSPVQIFDRIIKGDVKYKNQNDDNVIDQNDFRAFGYTAMPELTLGLHAGISYKNFDLEVQFQAAMNRSVYLKGYYYEAFQNNGQISSIALGRWTEETKENATYPRLSAQNNLNNFQESTLWQKNGDFLKLRNLELGYTLPELISGKLGLDGLRVFLSGVNLFSLDHMDGRQDPEAYLDGTGYSLPRSFSVGLTVQL
jgi:TonB-linked SusC/RagA family outer membrane protein